LGATVLAATLGAGSPVGAAGLAYGLGLSAWWWNGSAAFGSLALAFIVGPRIWREASRHGFYTAGDYLEFRYGGLVRGITSSLIWVGTIAILAGQLLAGAAVLHVVAGLPTWAGALAGGVVMTVYFTAGGLLSSAWVNAVQLVVLLAGMAIAVPLVVSHVGGFAALTAVPPLPAGFGDVAYSSGPGSGWTLLFLLGPAFIVSPGLIQKAYGARDASTVRLGIGVSAIALMLFAFIPVLLGMAARAAHPEITSPDLVLPTVLTAELPVWLGALALAAVFSAEVSSCDAILFMLATSLSKDLYKRFVAPEADDRQVLFAARVAAVTGGTLGVLAALVLPNVLSALTIFYSLLGVSLFVPVVGGLFVRRAGRPEALAAIAAGTLTLLALRFAGPGGWMDPGLLGLVASATAFGLVLAIRRPATAVS
ncbi:MAG: sodium:solute symporter family protein, partial [Vicinamibacterales bacterium]